MSHLEKMASQLRMDLAYFYTCLDGQIVGDQAKIEARLERAMIEAIRRDGDASLPLLAGGPLLSEEILRVMVEKDEPGGTICRACTRHMNRQPTPMNWTHGVMIIAMFKHFHRYPSLRWVHFDTIWQRYPKSRHCLNYSYFKYWDLAEACPSESTKKRHSGFWSITEKGVQFAKREIQLPRYALVEPVANVTGYDGELVGIQDVLGKEHDWAKEMGRAVEFASGEAVLQRPGLNPEEETP